jgi:AraC-like DNA-binding protein
MPSTITLDKLQCAREIIDLKYCEPLDIATLADTVGLSRAHFIREFHQAFGRSPHQYIVWLRMERATALLRMTDDGVAQICRAIGWRSVGSFTTRFKRTYGQSPTAYRRAADSSRAHA